MAKLLCFAYVTSANFCWIWTTFVSSDLVIVVAVGDTVSASVLTACEGVVKTLGCATLKYGLDTVLICPLPITLSKS